jgi:hypothetical protein
MTQQSLPVNYPKKWRKVAPSPLCVVRIRANTHTEARDR